MLAVAQHLHLPDRNAGVVQPAIDLAPVAADHFGHGIDIAVVLVQPVLQLFRRWSLALPTASPPAAALPAAVGDRSPSLR
ncbi:MAG: hypothetical protein EXR77_15545 [Myxococcales bacterium]|nr:hypothetical protein [Myxococcales bacterium]